VLGASVDHHTNRFEFRLFDSTNDGTTNYDNASITASAGGTRSSFEIALGVFSDWLKIDYPVRGKTGKAWCKVRVLPTGNPDRPFLAHFSRVLFATGDTDVAFTYPDTLANVLKREFDYYFPSKFLDRAIVPEYTRDSVRWATYFHGYDDWDLYFYVFTQTDNIQHIRRLSADRPVYHEHY
jgi:hypothetical protein